jgi:Uma2 family endonuclease
MVRLARQRKKVHVGPEDNGRRLFLDEFDHATVQEGFLYELGKGVIEVSDIPALTHGRQLQELYRQFFRYQDSHPDVIDYLAGGSDAKLLIGPSQSERHPDLMLYLSPAPDMEDLWSIWVPEIVIEIVSPSSAKRDYEEKPGEYREFGVREYWIIDAAKTQMTVLTRWRGPWKHQIIKPSARYTTQFLPDFSLDLKRIFATAKRK